MKVCLETFESKLEEANKNIGSSWTVTLINTRSQPVFFLPKAEWETSDSILWEMESHLAEPRDT